MGNRSGLNFEMQEQEMMYPMKNLLVYILALLFSSITLVSCQVVGDIFGAGVYTGIFVVIFIIVVIIFVVSRVLRKK